MIRLAAQIVCRGCGWKGDDDRVEVVVYDPEGERPAMAVRSSTSNDIRCGGCGALLDLWVEQRWHGDADRRARRRLAKGRVTVHGSPRSSC